MTRFEIIYHPEPHPSRQGKRFTVNADGHVFLADDPMDAVKACAAFLADLDGPVRDDDGIVHFPVDENIGSLIRQHNRRVVEMVEQAIRREG